jgi:hypothetical protein
MTDSRPRSTAVRVVVSSRNDVGLALLPLKLAGKP